MNQMGREATGASVKGGLPAELLKRIQAIAVGETEDPLRAAFTELSEIVQEVLDDQVAMEGRLCALESLVNAGDRDGP